MKIRKKDKIVVISGKDSSREGVVERVYATTNTVLIPGLNLFKKHVKKTEQTPQGGVVEAPRPIHVSKIMVVCPKCKKGVRIGYSVVDGKKMRICRKCKGTI